MVSKFVKFRKKYDMNKNIENSEKEQEKLYNQLTKDGYVCRILTL